MHRIVLVVSALYFSLSSNVVLAKTEEGISESLSSDIFSKYEELRKKTLTRLINLENRIDGLNPEFRELLGDRKDKYQTDFTGTGKPLPNPLLHYAVITERKRLENEEVFIRELSQSPLLVKQYTRKIASNLLVLETTNLLVTYVEYLDQYNRGERNLKTATRNIASHSVPTIQMDTDIMKVLAATLTALDYSKEKKASLAFNNPRITSLNPQETEATKKLIEAGLGPWDRDSLLGLNSSVSKPEQAEQEKKRLKQTKDLVSMLEGLASAFAVANKALGDEYQYKVLKLNQKVKNQLNPKSPNSP